MRSFTLGIIVTLLVLVLGGLAFALLGYMPSNANANPSPMEMRVAMNALDASMDRHAPRLSSPVPPTDDNLIEGMKIYTMNCALCHGTLDNKPSPLEHRSTRRCRRSFSTRRTIRSGTSTTPSRPASATPACRRGTAP